MAALGEAERVLIVNVNDQIVATELLRREKEHT